MLFTTIKKYVKCYFTQTNSNSKVLKIDAQQLLYQYITDIYKVFPEIQQVPHHYKLNFAKRIIAFINHYEFIEKGNFELTTNQKILVAASYVKLTLGYSQYFIQSFNKLIIYPSVQYFPDFDEVHAGHFNPKYGVIMLAIDEVEHDIHVPNDGKDIALHEFTHALCFEMLQKNAKHPNANHFKIGFQKIKQWFDIPENEANIKATRFLRDYAYSNHLELVSVLIECFFEKETTFKELFPDLYFFVGKMIEHPKTKI